MATFDIVNKILVLPTTVKGAPTSMPPSLLQVDSSLCSDSFGPMLENKAAGKENVAIYSDEEGDGFVEKVKRIGDAIGFPHNGEGLNDPSHHGNGKRQILFPPDAIIRENDGSDLPLKAVLDESNTPSVDELQSVGDDEVLHVNVADRNGDSSERFTGMNSVNGKNKFIHVVWTSDDATVEGDEDDDTAFSDVEEEETQYDVEEVLSKQNTHSLFCPNCKSRITRKVILKRKKVKNIRRPSSPASHHDKFDIFRCLSCFIFFIPKANRRLEEFSEDTVATNQTDPESSLVINMESETQGIGAINEPARLSRIRYDILPAVVYGGLDEALASLAIVSSAAGANAATVSILCMGIANLVGGFVILSKNVWEMKNDARHDENNPFRTALRNSFGLNSIIALLSYILFGVLPPLIYGLTFRKDDNKDYKMAAVAAASVVCITLLAAGRAYAWTRGTYLKTISTYLLVAISVSGISFIIGDLTYNLLKQVDTLDVKVDTHEGSWSSF